MCRRIRNGCWIHSRIHWQAGKEGREDVFAAPFELLIPQILDVSVRPEAGVVREVKARVIRIVIDHDLILIPEPVRGETYVERRDAPVEIIEPEATRSTTA